MTRNTATKRAASRDDDDTFDVSRARVVRRGPRNGRPSRRTIRSLRVASGLSQQALADATSIAQSELSRIERKDDAALREMTISTLVRILAALGAGLSLVAVFEKTGHRIEIVGHEGEE